MTRQRQVDFDAPTPLSQPAPAHGFYFSEFEARKPPTYPPMPKPVESAWQIMAGLTIGLGLWYLHWRWTVSLNPQALWFAIPVAVAETTAFIGTLLFFHDIWSPGDSQRRAPPHKRASAGLDGDGPIVVDLMITTYDEDPELVRLSIRDAARVRAPAGTRLDVHVLDDGDRPEMAAIAAREGARYHRRDDNRGFKAGNLKNALLASGGDFIVICDADTRLFPGFVENTLGYFRDPRVAWVQTPHWFYDIPQGVRRTGTISRAIGWLTGTSTRHSDPFLSDSGLFFDVIQRRRNRNGASFCCGAASIHRRETVFEEALTDWQRKRQACATLAGAPHGPDHLAIQATVLTPYQFHVSEDILTSIQHHSAPGRRWRSVYHPDVEARMLSPWGMPSWAAQKLKYAGGTFDIALRHNPLLKRGMHWRVKLHYAATFWSYFASFSLFVLLVAPAVALFTGIAPVAAYSADFFSHLLPLLVANELALVLGCWGHDARRGAMLPIASLGINFKAFWLAARGKRIAFKPTPKQPLIDPSLRFAALPAAVLGLTALAVAWGTVATVMNWGGHSWSMLVVNLFWAGWNMSLLSVPVRAALWRPTAKDELEQEKAGT